jgi:predicted permease
MKFFTWLRTFLAFIFHRMQVEREMEDELRAHLESRADDLERQGLPRAEAERQARLEFGGYERYKEECREALGSRVLGELVADTRYGLRQLRRSPGFTAVAVLTLALGIGANTAIFNLIDAVMLRMLPVEKPGELYQVQVGNADEGGGGSAGESPFPTPMWEQLRDHQDVFSRIFAWSGSNAFGLPEWGTAAAVNEIWVSGGFFSGLGLRPAAGRLIADSDDRRGCPAVAVLSYSFWQEHYGGAKSAVGSTLALGGHPFEVIGVAPPGFFGMEVGGKFDVAAPICATAILERKEPSLDNGEFSWLNVGGRINPKLSRAQQTARLRILATRLFVPPNASPEERDAYMKIILRLAPAATGISGLRGQFGQPLEILMVVVGIVLLIACANLASLTLARGAARHKEIAVRQALGASRTRLIRQLLTECALLSSAGALLGVLFAHWTAALLLHIISTQQNTVFLLDLSLNTRILGFVLAIATLTSLLIGLLPALRATRVSLSPGVKGSQSSEMGRGVAFRGRQWIVGSQVALSLVLLVAASLLLRSFVKLATLDAGFDRNNVLLVATHLKPAKLPPDRWIATYDVIVSRLKALPGVLSVGYSNVTPISGALMQFGIVQSDWFKLSSPSLRSKTSLKANPADPVCVNFVSPGYIPTLRIRLLAGRSFTGADLETSSDVAIVNETFSRRFFPHMNPIGRIFRTTNPGEKACEVVGLIEDSKYQSLREGAQAVVFLPVNQLPALFGDSEQLELRTAIPPSALVAPVRAAVGQVSSAIALEFDTLAEQVNRSLFQERMLALLSGVFGALALLLAMIGLYGTLSYLVTQRQAEFGIRMALGATRNSILGLVMRDLVTVLACGMAAGILISLAATRVLQQVLFGLGPRDMTTMLLAAGVLTAVALIAGYLPARRATKVDPMVALRYE